MQLVSRNFACTVYLIFFDKTRELIKENNILYSRQRSDPSCCSDSNVCTNRPSPGRTRRCVQEVHSCYSVCWDILWPRVLPYHKGNTPASVHIHKNTQVCLHPCTVDKPDEELCYLKNWLCSRDSSWRDVQSCCSFCSGRPSQCSICSTSAVMISWGRCLYYRSEPETQLARVLSGTTWTTVTCCRGGVLIYCRC